MQEYFHSLGDALFGQLKGEEQLLLGFSGEDSDFVRMNHNRIRQAGCVAQRSLSLDLIKGKRHAQASIELAGEQVLLPHRLRSELGIDARRAQEGQLLHSCPVRRIDDVALLRVAERHEDELSIARKGVVDACGCELLELALALLLAELDVVLEVGKLHRGCRFRKAPAAA